MIKFNYILRLTFLIISILLLNSCKSNDDPNNTGQVIFWQDEASAIAFDLLGITSLTYT